MPYPFWQASQSPSTVNEDPPLEILTSSLPLCDDPYITGNMEAIAYTLGCYQNYPNCYRPPQLPTSTDEDFSRRDNPGNAPCIPYYRYYPFAPPNNGYTPPRVPTAASPPSTSWKGFPPSNCMSGNDQTPTSGSTASFHSSIPPANPEETPTSNAPPTQQMRESSTDRDPQGHMGNYRSKVSTSATQRAASHRRKHEAKFACPHPNCNSRFTTARNKQNHENSHRNLKSFACSKCHLAMATRSNVLRHGKKQHPGLVIRAEPSDQPKIIQD
ncbi:hypothetical protein C0995_008209 [Termitomyces sp. Mi166|nr:hypothetical protein C0995_008209 [Termitomyces sp. Mi166\